MFAQLSSYALRSALSTLRSFMQHSQQPLCGCLLSSSPHCVAWWLQTVEAAHEVGMQCVVVAGRTPMYELTAADMVVRQLDELSFINLKQLFRLEHMVGPEVTILMA